MNDYFKPICERYINILGPWAYSECTPDKPTEDKHLTWMLKSILNVDNMSVTKKHRWLGYVQGIMVLKGYITVADEREFTRPLFNGD